MKRSTLRHALLLAPLLLMLSAPTLLAQIPDSFENLKVFPKDIGKEELVGQMRDMSAALGVRCTFCHHEKTPGDHRSIDWASDELASNAGMWCPNPGHLRSTSRRPLKNSSPA